MSFLGFGKREAKNAILDLVDRLDDLVYVHNSFAQYGYSLFPQAYEPDSKLYDMLHTIYLSLMNKRKNLTVVSFNTRAMEYCDIKLSYELIENIYSFVDIGMKGIIEELKANNIENAYEKFIEFTEGDYADFVNGKINEEIERLKELVVKYKVKLRN